MNSASSVLDHPTGPG